MARGSDFPLHVMYFEDLKLNGEKELDKLLKFLEADVDEQLKKDIIDACGFERMAQDKFLAPKEMVDKIFRQGFSIFRKGEIGDWKNWFTVADNEMFDVVWEKEMKNSSTFHFTYTT